MSKYAIISDVHGNVGALRAVLADIKEQNIGNTVCLGDIVGYYTNPNECVALIRENCSSCVVGNHDMGMFEDEILIRCKVHARRCLNWARDHITKETKEFLYELPLVAANKLPFAISHSSLHRPDFFPYTLSEPDCYCNFLVPDEAWEKLQKNKICFIGHTHLPMSYRAIKQGKDGYCAAVQPAEKVSLDFSDDAAYVVNVGSVGQPRDNDTRACYVVYDTSDMSIEYHRVDYNRFETIAGAIREDLPVEISWLLLDAGEVLRSSRGYEGYLHDGNVIKKLEKIMADYDVAFKEVEWKKEPGEEKE